MDGGGIIQYRRLTAAAPAAVGKLYCWAGGMKPEDNFDFGPAMIRGSFRFLGAFDGEELVGMARALSDGVSDGYIQDVVVLPAYRHCGIGRELVLHLVAELKAAGLIGAPGTEAFYRRLGFEPMRQFTPFHWVEESGQS